MSKIVILDNGHGGMIGGQYQTNGKRSPNWNKGVLYEGMFNRWIVNGVIKKLDYAKIPYYHVSPEMADVSLYERVRRANDIYRSNKNTYFVSIHANAGGGEGIEGFTTKGETPSDSIAEKFLCGLEELGQNQRYDFTDSDRDKETNYLVLRDTNCPAVLLELGFMDNKRDYEKLWDLRHQQEIINKLFKTIKDIYNGN